MLYPSIDRLLEKVDSKYRLVIIASQRAKEMQTKEEYLLTKYKSKKCIGKALEEVNEGEVYYTTE